MPKKKSKYYVRPDGLHETIRKIDGQRVAFRGRTDREVEQKMLAYKKEKKDGPLFKDVADEWQESHFPSLSPSTAHGYEMHLRNVRATFDNYHIKDITPLDVQRYIDKNAMEHFSRKTVSSRKLVLNLICKYAIVHNYISVNPCTAVNIPSNLNYTPRRLPSDNEMSVVAQTADKYFMPYFLLCSGLRRGEALALNWSDIDSENKVIHVNKSIAYDHNKPVLKTPKTKRGTRDVILLDRLTLMLPKKKPTGLVFPGTDGEYMNEAAFQKMWTKWKKETGLQVTAHQLRHGFATLLFEAEIPERDAMELLGHSSLAMTQELYAHIRTSRRKITANKINETAISFIKTQPEHSKSETP